MFTNESLLWFESAKPGRFEGLNAPLGRRGRLIFVAIGLLAIPTLVFAAFAVTRFHNLDATAAAAPELVFDNPFCGLTGPGNVDTCVQNLDELNLDLVVSGIDDESVLTVDFELFTSESFNLIVTPGVAADAAYTLDCPGSPWIISTGTVVETCVYTFGGITADQVVSVAQEFVAIKQ